MADPVGREVDRVSVRVLPNLKRFLPDLEKYLKKIETRVRVEIPTNLDTAGLMQEAEAAAAAIERAIDVDIPVSAQTKKAEAQIAKVARTRTATVRVDVDRHSLSNVLSSITSMTAGIASGVAKGGLLGLGAGGLVVSASALLGVIAQATGALAVLPALALGAATSVGILGAAFIGLGDATDSLSTGVRDQLAAIGKAIQDTSRQALFPGLTLALQTFRNEFLPVYLEGIEKIGAKLGELTQAFANAMALPQTLKDTARGMGDMALGLDNLQRAVGPFVRAFRDIAVVGGSLIPGLTESLAGSSREFARFIAEARKSGSLEDFIAGSLAAVGSLVSLLGNVGGAIAGIARAAQNAGGGLFGGLDTLFARLNDFLNSIKGQKALEGLFSGIVDGFGAIGDAMGPVGKALTKVLPALGDALATVGSVLGALLANAAPLVRELIQPVAEVLAVVGDALVTSLNKVGPALLPAAKAYGAAISAIAVALAPLVPALAQGLGDLATAFADHIIAIAPLVPAIVTALVDQLLPLIPAIVEALVSLLPGLTELTLVLAENLPGIIANLGPLVQGISDLLPVLGELVGVTLSLAAALTAILLPMEMARVAFTNKALGGALSELAILLQGITDALGGDWSGAAANFAHFLAQLTGALVNTGIRIGIEVAKLPQTILDGVSGFGTLLYDAGASLITGLINGMKAGALMLPRALGDIAGAIGGFFPGSPIKEGPLTSWNNGGAGKRLMDQLASGIESRTGAVKSAANGVAGLFDDPSMQVAPADMARGGGVPLINVERLMPHDYNEFRLQARNMAAAVAGGGVDF